MALLIVVAVVVLFVVFYGGYNKAKQAYDFGPQLAKLGARDVNKLAGLAGISVLSLAALLKDPALRFWAAALLVLHAVTSFYFVLELSVAKYLASPRVVALALGSTALTLTLLSVLSSVQWTGVALLAALVHFVGMELRPGPYR